MKTILEDAEKVLYRWDCNRDHPFTKGVEPHSVKFAREIVRIHGIPEVARILEGIEESEEIPKLLP